jgi:hypothetical protein
MFRKSTFKKYASAFLSIFIAVNAYSQNNSFSFDPITFVQLLFLPSSNQNHEEPVTNDIRNLWLCIEANWELRNRTEMGAGVFLRGDRFALRTQWRSYFNKQRQSGAFIGLYGLVEYRQMYWNYDEDDRISIGYSFPFIGEDNVYKTFGVTIGFDVGFRLRVGDAGITPFIGLGLPLFFYFGDLPPRQRPEFDFQNTIFRAIDIGIRIDFFQPQWH